ncbi:MAG: alkaline phosphatase [Deltaproteobacteria bacterium RIFOXYD12_FULL_56_24]|nr:MAG: alkaline phosphatase [Deltaproteobacteria bacterium RIFOXYD12_FULL_56_24]
MRMMEHLLNAVREAAVFNPEVQVAPACILWPDRDRQWEAVIPLLQAELPELFILGDYAPERRTGPAIWLRCVIAGKTDDLSLPKGLTPILYLPGVSRQDLRAVESCPDHLKPLAELQYRGVIWSQINAKDWTILAYLKSDQGGLGLDAAQDSEAKNAMQLALYRLLDEDLKLLAGKRLDKDFFNTLLTGGDPTRDLLLWLDLGDGFRGARSENEWQAFVEVCKSQLAFHPEKEGVLTGAAKLAGQEGPWRAVWQRFCEAPHRYPNLPARIRQCQAPNATLFWHSTDGPFSGWPQWNDDQEKSLRRDLLALAELPAHQARKKLLDLEGRHGHRRRLVWAELGEAPLVQAMEHLARLAEVTGTGLAAGTLDDLVSGFSARGWQADDALLHALARLEAPADLAVISGAIRAAYLPWAEESARYLQKTVSATAYPGGSILSRRATPVAPGECLFFVDGLRFDLAKRLEKMLAEKGKTVGERPYWVPLPSVTGTGKPAMAPVLSSSELAEETVGYNFEPLTAYLLRKIMVEQGWRILDRAENGDGQGKAWCEFGDIDHEGHSRGAKIARHLDPLLIEIRDRIIALLDAGWQKVRVVTDHGWLLLPDGLPKTELPACLVDSKWGRCAAIKQGAATDERLYPWYWNPEQLVALADGISCYRQGEEYAHGGLSLQECLVLELTVSRSAEACGAAGALVFTDIVWKGLRCTVAVTGDCNGLSLDIRRQAGDPAFSVVVGVKELKGNGTASVVVEDEELEGQPAVLVLCAPGGALAAQVATVIGGEKE